MSRTETFERTRPNGEVVVITRDIDTGEQEVKVREGQADQNQPQAADGDQGKADPQGQPAPERPSRGASLAAWVEFAQAVKFEHAEGASRDEIRDAYEAAHPAE